MSTRSLVGIQNKDGSVNYVYIHSDGYLTGVGKTLFEKYSDRKKVRRLVNLGDLSSLGERIGYKHPFDLSSLYPNHWTDPVMRAKYEADPRQNFTRAYGRDRGEKDVGFRTVLNLRDFKKQSSGTEFWYIRLYRSGWAYSDRLKRDFHLLTPKHFVKKV